MSPRQPGSCPRRIGGRRAGWIVGSCTVTVRLADIRFARRAPSGHVSPSRRAAGLPQKVSAPLWVCVPALPAWPRGSRHCRRCHDSSQVRQAVLAAHRLLPASPKLPVAMSCAPFLRLTRHDPCSQGDSRRCQKRLLVASASLLAGATATVLGQEPVSHSRGDRVLVVPS